MDLEKILLLIIATELNTSNRLKLSELAEFTKSESYMNTLLANSKTENAIASLLDNIMKGVMEPNE